MTIPNGSRNDFYQISTEGQEHLHQQQQQSTSNVTFPTTAGNITETVYNLLMVANSSSSSGSSSHFSYYNTPPTNISANQLHEFGPFEASDSISSYNVDTIAAGGGYPPGGGGLEGETFVEAHKEFVFDRTDVRIVFITLYSLVFCCCFFGNLLVILVVTLSRRLRSITNFFLANLAVADLCVGIFCVMQNLSTYLITSWVFGDFLCKMYQFVHSLSSTASIFILVVICMERYFAIIHPITCKQTLTSRRLRLVIVGVWITSAIYSLPKFIYVHTVTMVHTTGVEETICVPNRRIYNSEVFDMINFGLLYVTPLLVMTVLYSRIAITLWQSSRQLDYCIPMQNVQLSSMGSAAAGTGSGTGAGTAEGCDNVQKVGMRNLQHRPANGTAAASVSLEPPEDGEELVMTTRTTRNGNGTLFPPLNGISAGGSSCDINQQQLQQQQLNSTDNSNMFVQHKMVPIPQSSYNILRARRGVIRMLIVVVLTFALCNLPFHARKIWQYWSKNYEGDSNFNALFTPLTFLVAYFNSGVNPLLYAFLSRNFRNGVQEVFQCVFKRRNKKGNGGASFHRAAAPIHSMATETNLM